MKTILCTAALVALTANASVAQETDQSQMLALTQSVLQGINGTSEPAPQEQQTDLSSLIAQAMEEGQSDAYLEALIGEAVERGSIEVPEAMVSTEGEVDTETLLASLVSQSLQGTDADQALVSEATNISGEQPEPRRHTVVSGDSLAGIARRYYGDATKFDTIYEANRDTIERPSLIRVGQVILIP